MSMVFAGLIVGALKMALETVAVPVDQPPIMDLGEEIKNALVTQDSLQSCLIILHL